MLSSFYLCVFLVIREAATKYDDCILLAQKLLTKDWQGSIVLS